MSPLGNANQLAMVKQYMILEEMQSGYSGQVSDGRMFKQVGPRQRNSAVSINTASCVLPGAARERGHPTAVGRHMLAWWQPVHHVCFLCELERACACVA